MAFDQQYGFRRSLVESLERDMLGPREPREVIADPPATTYVTGVLFPMNEGLIDPDQDNDAPEEDDDSGTLDTPVALAHVRYPSSMGLTFAVDLRSVRIITVHVSAARYEPLEQLHEDSSEPQASLSRGAPTTRWQRLPLDIQPFDIDVSVPIHEKWFGLSDGLDLYARVRRADERDAATVTLVLVNKLPAPPGHNRDRVAFFQPAIRVEAQHVAAFVDRRRPLSPTDDSDLRSYRLLFRHITAIAVGHGCSTAWTDSVETPGRARAVWTTFIPRCEVPVADSNPKVQSDALRMRFLATGDRSRVTHELEGFCRGYGDWIELQRPEMSSLEAEFGHTPYEHLAGCQDALGRMQKGVTLLQSDDHSWQAFQFANKAMLQVRARTVWRDGGRRSEGPQEDDSHVWRPFQLAFVLLCLESIGNRGSEDRDIADLLWFPTGGGKTEAYLALIAFLAFLRRLRDRSASSAGVTVIMRYTLRLLTAQQFERAANLICSCEMIRRSKPELGQHPISIGLWVGRGGTPNTLRDARRALDRLRLGLTPGPDEGNPMQLRTCLWCGEPLGHSNYFIAKSNPHLVIACRRPKCLFRDELPVYVVDEDIYRFRPTLLVATSDKFASLPWRESVGNLFGSPDGVGQPPELIVQDELHLISGPLGTLAGLYETAIDALCSRGTTKPKIIASTATIRRAGAQGSSLFARQVRQFPPPGLDSRNSYFAVEAAREDRPARLYVGLMTSQVSHTTLLIRAYSALLQYGPVVSQDPQLLDPYWTLVGYFNSLRVLGGARMQVQDDVGDRIGVIAGQALVPPRSIDEIIELSSREPSGDIPEHLARMALRYPSPEALDVILATNMISVGVDIDRLGLMVVMGQPPTTSEYIQATSRVGRRYPGLIVTLYNASRSRDRSHYEQFVDYHSALYRHVESTSVTPFSTRARDRALHAVLIALARLIVAELAPREGARRILEPAVRSKLDVVKDIIALRAAQVDPGGEAAVVRQLNQIIEAWEQRARDVKSLVYDDPMHPDLALLIDASATDDLGQFPTLWSLRDVDAACGLYQVR